MTMTGRGGLKDLDIMLKFKQEIHKNGEVFAWGGGGPEEAKIV